MTTLMFDSSPQYGTLQYCFLSYCYYCSYEQITFFNILPLKSHIQYFPTFTKMLKRATVTP